jgi:TP901 family phage tail tape measure protein
LAEDGSIDVKYGLDASQASAELDLLRKQLNAMTGDLLHAQKTIAANTARMTSDLRKLMTEARGADILRVQRREESAFARSTSFQSRGSRDSQITEAAVRQIIADTRASETAIRARMTDELVRGYVRTIKNTNEAIAARLKGELARVDNLIANSNDELVRARGILAQRNRDRQIYEANNGPGAGVIQGIHDRFNLNGGADMMGIQGRVMTNFMALGSAFMAVRNLTGFVVELDKELKNFQAISQATNLEMVSLKERFMDLAATVPFTTLEMAKAATTLSQAGLSTREVVESLGSVARFATASGSDLATSVDVVTSAITAFNLQTSQTANVADTLTSALNLSKLTIDKLVTAMNYIGPTANEMGMSLEETVAILGALSQSGLRASTMATGMRALLVDLQNPSQKFLKILKDMGLSQQDVNVESEGFLNVLEKLKEGGFGAAQAYEAFELRAAAAFVALQNNTDLAYEMQKAFTLSNAAMEANTIQMTSLANTASNFYSVIGGLALTAFEPVIAVMQSTLASATDVLSVLQQFPGALEAIGIAAALVGGVTVLGVFSALFRGVVGMVPVLSTFAAGWRGVAVGIQGTTGAMGALLAVMRGHPLIMIASLVMAGVTALYSFGSATKTVAEEMDALRTRINAITGESDALDKKMASIEQTLENVVRQKDALDNNPLMREAKILEIQRQFKELGGTIEASTASVTDLIRELHNLKDAQQDLQNAQAGAKVAAGQELVTGRQRQLSDYFEEGASQKVVRQLLASLFNPDEFASISRSAAPGTAEQELRRLGIEKARTTFNNPSIDRILAILGGDRSQLDEQNPQKVAALLANLEQEISRLGAQRNQATSPEVINNLEDLIGFLTALKEQFATVNQLVTDLASSRQDLKVDELKKQTEVIESTPTYRDLARGATDLEIGIRSDLQAIMKGERGQSDADKIDAIEILRANVADKLKALRSAESQIIKEAMEADPTLTPAQASRVVKQLIDGSTASLNLQLKTLERQINEPYQKFLDKQFKADQQKISRELKRLTSRRADALTQEEIDLSAESINVLLESRATRIRQFFEDKISRTENEDDKRRLTEEMEQALEEVANLVEDQAIETAKRSNELLIDSLKQQQKGVEDNAAALTKKIDEATQALAKMRPGQAMDALIESINLMIKQLGELNGQSNSLQFQQDALSLNRTPITGNMADRAAKAMEYFMTMGLNKIAASGIVGNLAVESGLNPYAAGDYRNGHPTAHGIAQHRGDRWDALVGSTSTPWDFMSQLQFIMKEMGDKFPGLIEQLNSAADPAEAARLFMQKYEKPNSDPNVNHIGRRIGYANSLASNDYAGQQAEIESQRQKLIDAELKATTKAVTASMDAQIKNANKQLGRLSTQVKISSTTESIEQITASVRKWHADIMEAELKKFDQENIEAAKQDPDGINAQREELKARLRAAMIQDITKLQEEYYQSAEDEINQPVEEARMKRDIASRPEFASKYTNVDLMGLDENVRLAERKALLDSIAMVEQQIALAKADQALYEEGTPEMESALLREAELKARLIELTREKNAVDAATAAQGPSIAAAIRDANIAWQQQEGILDSAGKLVPVAQQVGKAWQQVLSGLSSAFSNFFMNITSGTMSAGEAFKKLGLDIINMFMQIIAKALANQIIMKLFNMEGGSGLFGNLFSGLFSSSTGGGIPGAAGGEYITGGIPNRDSTLRRVMPGEYILRASAVKAIGRGKLDEMNNLANRQISESPPPAMTNDNKPQGTGAVNVWVVSPDQVPPPGPNDIVATIADNIQRRGSIKQLIQQVQMGSI